MQKPLVMNCFVMRVIIVLEHKAISGTNPTHLSLPMLYSDRYSHYYSSKETNTLAFSGEAKATTSK
jgi:hypothetical protein